MKRCPKCMKDFPDDANFCPVDAGHLIAIDPSEAAPTHVPRIDTAGNELLDGRFIMGDIIAGSRSGPVYQAGDKQGSTAMVKLVDPRVFPTALLKQRTERELKQLERLEHPGVAKVLGHGRREDALWIAMERVDGIPLSQFVAEQGALAQNRVIDIVGRIGSALEAAAKLGVTHRDLAPKNVLIGANDQIKLINFGVPVMAAEGSEVQGVVEFVAPEQAEGRPVDQRCNIYSLGAIAYMLLTKAPPFTGSAAEVLAAHNSGTVRPLGAAEGVSALLSSVLLKSLEKSSSKRFMTLRQFLGDLDNAKGSTSEAELKAASPSGKKSSAEVNKTLMGVAPAEIQALLAAAAAKSPAVGTPAPAETAHSTAETSIDHKAPSMSQVDAVKATVPAEAIMGGPTTPDMAVQTPAPEAPAVAAVTARANVPAGGKRKGNKSKAPPEKADPKSKGKFRETMWFKKGELDEAAAKAAAKSKPEDTVSSKADEMEMEERYTDDGSITQQDKERLSLRTGATMMMEAVEQRNSGPGVSEADLVSEMTEGRNKIFIALGLAVVVIVGIALLAF